MPAGEEERDLLGLGDHDQAAGPRVDDVVDPLAQRRARGDDVQGPQQTRVLPRLQLVQLVAGVRHLVMMAKALLAGMPWRIPCGQLGMALVKRQPQARRWRRAARKRGAQRRLAGAQPIRRASVAAAGASTGASPNFTASATRRSAWPTERSSPVSPTSPKQASGRPPASASGSPRCAETSASATARSAPGSSTRTPPATLTKTSAPASDGPPWRASTASTIARRLRSIPFATRRGGHDLGRRDQRLDLDQQRPRALHRAEDDRARRGARLGDEARRRVDDLDQAAGAHLEDADLAGRAEAVLERAQGAEAALALALEEEHAVDQVLEHPRAGDRALLGHVADEDHRAVEPLRDLHDPRPPPRGPGRPSPGAPVMPSACSVWIESITQASGRSASSVATHRLERGLGERRDRERAPRRGARRAAAPGRPTPRPRRRARRGRRRARLPSAIPVSVDLPIPGEPPSSTSEPGTRPPPSTRSSSAMPVAKPRRPRGAETSRRATGLPAAAPAAAAARRAAALRRLGLRRLDQRVPLAAAGAAPRPGAAPRGRRPGRRRRSSRGPSVAIVRTAPDGSTGALSRDRADRPRIGARCGFVAARCPLRDDGDSRRRRAGRARAAAGAAAAFDPALEAKNFAKTAERDAVRHPDAGVPAAPDAGERRQPRRRARRSRPTTPSATSPATSAPTAASECAGDVRFYDWKDTGFGDRQAGPVHRPQRLDALRPRLGDDERPGASARRS